MCSRTMEFPGGSQVEDLALTRLGLWLLLWCGFDPWPRNLYMPWVQPKKKKKKKLINLESALTLKMVLQQSQQSQANRE